tara:strand:+ start:146 stop:439 length:294 start_codon:yes stop_codon:yes gene_type:complete
MPRPIVVSDSDKQWLTSNHKKLSYHQLADRLGCCVDTLKRILVREGLQEFDGAKYQVRRDFEEKKWAKPCIGCGDTKSRPKNYFFCTSCRREMGYED